MFHKLLFVTILLYVVVVSIVAVLLVRASPGPASQEILGMALGRYEVTYGNVPGTVYISGRRLTCITLSSADPFRQKCSITIAGKDLEIYARRNQPPDPNDFGGACQAWYEDKQWSCEIGSRHIGVNWFAHIDPPLGLSQDQLQTIRRQYPIENLDEQPFVYGIAIVVTISTMLAALGTSAWMWSRPNNTLIVVGASLVVGSAAFILSGVLAVSVTRGFWD
jgi:hypothetical protein